MGPVIYRNAEYEKNRMATKEEHNTLENNTEENKNWIRFSNETLLIVHEGTVEVNKAKKRRLKMTLREDYEK